MCIYMYLCASTNIDFYRNVDKNEENKPEVHAVRLPMVNNFYKFLEDNHPELRYVFYFLYYVIINHAYSKSKNI